MLSVLMSVYNETEQELWESVESILAQTFKDFEFIIVNDNPERKELKEILHKIKTKDSRVKVINNETNIGLALSLNKAAETSTGEIFIRMDADDISHPDRFLKQMNEIRKGYDLVFTSFIFIDECSNLINSSSSNLDNYSTYDIHNCLPLKNMIHHPTVAMTKEIFMKAGRYRAFQVAQDYDLWLRIYDVGGKFKMMDSPLLKYRVRETSITRTKKYQQKVTLDYTRKLLIERAIFGKDSYSKEAYENYLKEHDAYNPNNAKRMEYYNNILKDAKKSLDQKSYLKYFYYRLKVFILSNENRRDYLMRIRDKVILKFYIQRNLRNLS